MHVHVFLCAWEHIFNIIAQITWLQNLAQISAHGLIQGSSLGRAKICKQGCPPLKKVLDYFKPVGNINKSKAIHTTTWHVGKVFLFLFPFQSHILFWNRLVRSSVWLNRLTTRLNYLKINQTAELYYHIKELFWSDIVILWRSKVKFLTISIEVYQDNYKISGFRILKPVLYSHIYECILPFIMFI